MNSQEVENNVLNILRATSSSPFLFVGSGFSRRYFDLPQWDELLKKFCRDEDEFDELMATASKKLPNVATLLAQRYHDRWWSENAFSKDRDNFKVLSNGKKLSNKT